MPSIRMVDYRTGALLSRGPRGRIYVFIRTMRWTGRVIPLVLFGLIVLYIQNREAKYNHTGPYVERYIHTRQSTAGSNENYKFASAESEECKLYDVPDNYRAILKYQKRRTFRMVDRDHQGLCAHTANCVMIQSEELGTWRLHCPSLKCAQFYCFYLNRAELRVTQRVLNDEGELFSLLETGSDIEQVKVFGICRPSIVGLAENVSMCVDIPITKASDIPPTKPLKHKPNPGRNQSVHIEVIYLHFLSRLQFKTWLPKTAGLLKTLQDSRLLSVFDYKKYQSIHSRDWAFLRTFLFGRCRDNPAVSTCHSIIDTAEQYGYTPTILDLTCRSSQQRTNLLKNAQNCSRFTDPPCVRVSMDSSLRSSLCSSEKFLQLNTPDLEYLMLRTPQKDKPSFGVTFLSLADLQSVQDVDNFDRLLSAVVQKRADFQSSMTIIISDIGYVFTNPPPLTTFDHSHISNALLLIILPTRTVDALRDKETSTLLANQQRLISIDDVHSVVSGFLKCGIVGLRRLLEVDTEDSHHTPALDGTDSYSAPNYNRLLWDSVPIDRTCESLNVSAPHLCICQGQPILFRNDTIQVAATEFILGKLNGVIRSPKQQGTRYSYRPNVFFQGIRFFEPQISTYNKSTALSVKILVGKYEVFPKNQFLGCQLIESALEWTCSDNSPFCDTKVMFSKFVEPTSKKYYHQEQVCNHSRENSFYNVHNESPKLSLLRISLRKHFGYKPRYIPLSEGCLFLFVTDFGKSVSFSVANICQDRSYSMRLNLKLKHVVSLTRLPVVANSISPQEIRFLTVVVQTSYFVFNKEVRFTAKVTKH